MCSKPETALGGVRSSGHMAAISCSVYTTPGDTLEAVMAQYARAATKGRLSSISSVTYPPMRLTLPHRALPWRSVRRRRERRAAPGPRNARCIAACPPTMHCARATARPTHKRAARVRPAATSKLLVRSYYRGGTVSCSKLRSEARSGGLQYCAGRPRGNRPCRTLCFLRHASAELSTAEPSAPMAPRARVWVWCVSSRL